MGLFEQCPDRFLNAVRDRHDTQPGNWENEPKPFLFVSLLVGVCCKFRVVHDVLWIR